MARLGFYTRQAPSPISLPAWNWCSHPFVHWDRCAALPATTSALSSTALLTCSNLWRHSRIQFLELATMRILFCNKYNFRFSGTEAYLFGLMKLLESAGHEVALFSMDSGAEDK